MLVLQHPLVTEDQRNKPKPRFGCGLFYAEHEVYPADLVDPRTGIKIGAGLNVFVHTDGEPLTIDDADLAIVSMCNLASHVRSLGRKAPRQVLSITHEPMARVATRWGFRRALIEQGMLTPEYVAAMRYMCKDLSADGVNMGDSNRLQLLFMPTSDLLRTYTDTPTRREVVALGVIARSESRAIELTALQNENLRCSNAKS